MLPEVESGRTQVADRLQIGAWTVEPALHRLLAEGRTVKLEPKSMAVLLHLASRPGQVISREALFRAAWPGVIVGEDSLNQVVLKLRRAFGDTSEEPAYIETISKAGYRLVAPVRQLASPAPTGSKPKSHWLAATLAAILVLAVSAGAFWMRTEPASVHREAAGADKPTLAIWPFEALRDDPVAAVLARGIAEDLATDLSKVRQLEVVGFVAQQSRAERPRQSVSIRYLVSGSVERSGAQLRVHVRLADAESGKQLWSERFDRTLSDFFTIQDELTPRILQRLSANVSRTELERIARRYTRDLEAYEYFQRGRLALQRHHQTGTEPARQLFWRAIQLDSNFARAYSGLAMSHVLDYRRQQDSEATAALDRAFELARTAYQMDSDIPETYWTLAHVHEHRRQHQQAMRYLQSALKLFPSYADGYALMGSIYTHMGSPEKALPLLRKAMRLNPDGRQQYFIFFGRAYLFLGDLEQARVNLEEAVKRNPGTVEARVYLAAVYSAAGDETSAQWQADEIRAIHPGFSARLWVEATPLINPTQKAKLHDALAVLKL